MLKKLTKIKRAKRNVTLSREQEDTIERPLMAAGMVFGSMVALAALATIATVKIADAGTLVTPGVKPFKVISAQMGIKNPITNACPAKAHMTLWIKTTKPGPVSYMIAKKGGGVSGPFTIQAVKGGNGISMATFSKTYDIHQPFNAQYRVLVSGTNGKVMSNWVTMRASCKILLGG